MFWNSTVTYRIRWHEREGQGDLSHYSHVMVMQKASQREEGWRRRRLGEGFVASRKIITPNNWEGSPEPLRQLPWVQFECRSSSQGWHFPCSFTEHPAPPGLLYSDLALAFRGLLFNCVASSPRPSWATGLSEYQVIQGFHLCFP